MSEGARQGGCRCGRVRFEASGKPLLTMACHCTGCQRMTASAFSLTDTYPADSFKVTEGETVIGGMHGATRHHFCDYCKSWVHTKPEGLDEIVNVRSTLFDQPARERPFVEVFTREGLPWAKTGAEHSFSTLPEMDEWPKLIGQFAGRATAWGKEEFNP
ncbi:MAG TPA: GFA family protein [Sphingomicrobium sp.]|nr:GFA family protein [Sphingomicrobium sp.]